LFELKQNATDKVIPFLMVSSTDYLAGKPLPERDGIGNGWYKFTAAADTNTPGLLHRRHRSRFSDGERRYRHDCERSNIGRGGFPVE
jgi:hypothetical protein